MTEAVIIALIGLFAGILSNLIQWRKAKSDESSQVVNDALELVKGLEGRVAKMYVRISDLEAQNERLEGRVRELRSSVDELTDENKVLCEDNCKLRQRVVELEHEVEALRARRKRTTKKESSDGTQGVSGMDIGERRGGDRDVLADGACEVVEGTAERD